MWLLSFDARARRLCPALGCFRLARVSFSIKFMVSERTLAAIPDVVSLRRLTQSLAMLEAILCPPPDLRYYAFDSRRGDGEMLASMDNGAGDHYFILFSASGAVIKGFDHESVMSPHAGDGVTLWRGVLDEVPQGLRSLLSESAFMIEDTTFCIWRCRADAGWRAGRIDYPGGDADADGSGWMLPVSKTDAESYREWARGYHGAAVDGAAVSAIYEHQPLTEAVVKNLNASLSLADVAADVEAIGYPRGAA